MTCELSTIATPVIPAKAGIHFWRLAQALAYCPMDPGFRRGDGFGEDSSWPRGHLPTETGFSQRLIRRSLTPLDVLNQAFFLFNLALGKHIFLVFKRVFAFAKLEFDRRTDQPEFVAQGVFQIALVRLRQRR